jgi:hypothetical protein
MVLRLMKWWKKIPILSNHQVWSRWSKHAPGQIDIHQSSTSHLQRGVGQQQRMSNELFLGGPAGVTERLVGSQLHGKPSTCVSNGWWKTPPALHNLRMQLTNL